MKSFVKTILIAIAIIAALLVVFYTFFIQYMSTYTKTETAKLTDKDSIELKLIEKTFPEDDMSLEITYTVDELPYTVTLPDLENLISDPKEYMENNEDSWFKLTEQKSSKNTEKVFEAIWGKLYLSDKSIKIECKTDNNTYTLP